VDGGDTCADSRTASKALRATRVHVRANFTSRHAAADVFKFGKPQAYFLDIWRDANNYIRAYWSAANTVTLAYNAQGAGEQTAAWNATGLWVAAATKLVELKASGSGASLIVAGATVASIAGAVQFATDFVASTDVHYGHKNDGTCQYDGTITSP